MPLCSQLSRFITHLLNCRFLASKRGFSFRKRSQKKTNGIPIAVFPDYVMEKLKSETDNFQNEFKVIEIIVFLFVIYYVV